MKNHFIPSPSFFLIVWNDVTYVELASNTYTMMEVKTLYRRQTVTVIHIPRVHGQQNGIKETNGDSINTIATQKQKPGGHAVFVVVRDL